MLPDRVIESPSVPPRLETEPGAPNHVKLTGFVDVDQLTANFGWESAVRLLHMFVDQTPKILAEAASALDAKDLSKTRAMMHELQGYCATISMNTIAALAKQLSETARTGAWEKSIQIHKQLSLAFEEAKKEISLRTQLVSPHGVK